MTTVPFARPAGRPTPGAAARLAHPLRAAMLGAALLLGGVAGPASAQPMLYEQRLPEGFAFIRIANALPEGATIRPDFRDPVTLGGNGAERVSPYYVAEDVANRPVKFQVTIGGTTTEVQTTVKGGGLNTVILQRRGNELVATSVEDQQEYNQTRARLTFYNAVAGCDGGALALDPSGQSVFSGVGPMQGRTRSVAPAAAVVRPSCGNQRAANLDLGRLQAGGLYSVWLMAPQGQPTAFLVRDTITR
ncbi:ABC transporter permease [Muricoccus radiodurans]|uniref:ABC transporter permease n=1 Tax=Muricoccus radiodurans TaxID=2231721 RepID=UPI003CEEFD78